MRPINRIDRHLGRKVRLRRIQFGMELQELAAAVEVSGDEMEDYEAGRARMDAPMIFRICRLLSIPSHFLFDSLVLQPSKQVPRKSLLNRCDIVSEYPRI